MIADAKEIRLKAKAWMILNNISQKDIQIELGMANLTLVCDTMAGRRNIKSVLNLLLKKGCPREYLAFPSDIKEMRKAA